MNTETPHAEDLVQHLVNKQPDVIKTVLRTRHETTQDSTSTAVKIDLTTLHNYINPDVWTTLVQNPDNVLADLHSILEQWDDWHDHLELHEREHNLPNHGLLDVTGVSIDVEVMLVNPPSTLTLDVAGDHSEYLDTLVSVRGTIVGRTDSKPVYEEAVYVCQRCGTQNHVPQHSTDDLKEPYQCESCERQGPFQIDDKKSELTDVQNLKVRQRLKDTHHDDPATVQARAETKYRTNQTSQGEDTQIVGILRTDNSDSAVQNPWIEIVGVESLDDDSDVSDVSQEDREIIQNIASRHNHLDDVAEAIVPGIYGRDVAKKLVWLQQMNPEWDGDTRGNIHLLMIGDASTGKTNLQQAAEDIAPKTATTSGDSSTDAGLIAAAVQDDLGFGGGDTWTFKAGILPRAHGGTAIIDELDKLSGNADSLNKALSDGEVPWSKAGQSTRLSTRANALIAANPESGDWDDNVSRLSQIEFSGPLLSRCIIIPFSDDREHDAEIAESVFANHSDEGPDTLTIIDNHIEDPETDCEHPHDLLAKWVKLSDDVNPELTDDAQDYLKDAYTTLRDALADDESNEQGLKVRDLEDMIRLSKAHAKSRLSEDVTKTDAEVAVDLITECLERLGFRATTVNSGGKNTQSREYRAVRSALRELGETEDGHTPDDIQRQLEMEITDGQLNHILSNLTSKGDVVKPADGRFRPA